MITIANLLFADGHMHSNPITGMGIAKVGRKFIESGGWFAVLVSLPPYHYGFENSFEGYIKSIDVLIKECKTAKEVGLKVLCLSGVHPAAIESEVTRDPKHGLWVLEKAIAVIDYAAKLVREGVIDGFGEVGRPHYKAIPEAFVVNNIVTRYALTRARDLGSVVHLHLEQGGELTALDIENLVNDVRIPKGKVILHHVDISTARASQKRGLVFTVPGKYPVLKEAFKSLGPTYMVESDFIDDPKRPGVSSYPWDIVANQLRLLREGIVEEEYIYKLNVDFVAKTYGIEPP